MKGNRHNYILFWAFFLILTGSRCYADEYLTKSNEFIEVSYNLNSHRFWLRTTGGNPEIGSDNNKKLLYHSESVTETSYLTVNIDGTKYIYGYDFPAHLKVGINNEDTISSYCIFGNKVEVKQKISIVKGLTTDNYDTLKIEYRAKNFDSKPHRVGLRLLFDTYLGDNDGAPFSVPGMGSVTTDTSLKGGQIPDYWYVFDSISKPTVSAMSTMRLSGYIEPDEVVFSNWDRLYHSRWESTIKQGRKFKVFLGGKDSACAIYWNPVILVSGQEQKYAVTYGIYKATIKFSDAINVAVGCPERVRENMPFTVSCDIENRSIEYPLDDVDVMLILPPGVVLSDSRELQNKMISRINPGEIAQASWNLRLRGVKLDKAKFSVKIVGKLRQHGNKNAENFSVEVQSRTPNIEPPKSLIESSVRDFIKNLQESGIKSSPASANVSAQVPEKNEILPVAPASRPSVIPQGLPSVAETKKVTVDKEIFVVSAMDSVKLTDINTNITKLTDNIKRINSTIDEINSKLEKINKQQIKK